MLLLNLPIEQIHRFLFILVRVASMLTVIPFFESRNVPFLVKSGLAMAVTWLLMPQVSGLPPSLNASPVAFALGLASEVIIGLIIGFMLQLVFVGVQLAGQTAGFQMGFAIANVVDPASSMQIPILSQFLNLFALMIFLSLDIHHYFIKALVDGFEIIPFWAARFDGNIFSLLVRTVSNAFVIAVKIGAPVMVALLLTSVALGLISRTVPQMQIFIVAMPVKIILGLLFLGFSLPFCMNYLKIIFVGLGRMLQGVLRMMI
jgi:flagellar biosynthetic protein FliR